MVVTVVRAVSDDIEARMDGPPPPKNGIDVGFQNLCYAVRLKTKGKKTDAPTAKTIIADASGICHAGRLLAIMGPSGAGKTSLLDILAGRKSQSAGHLSLGGGVSASPRQIQQRSAYVQQDDAIMASQTAREAVVMAALLTLPKHMDHLQKLARVVRTMKEFELEGCADTMVGDPLGKVKGLSGGERKRCAVAMAAIREPEILFLDEPTSGLDAFKALHLMQVLKGMVQGSKSTVICTIHQPSSDIFTILDDLMLLLKGRTVFHAAASEAVNYFGRMGYACPQYANPADFFFMHVLTSEKESRITELVTAWANCSAKDATVQKFFSCDGAQSYTSVVSCGKSGSDQTKSSQWTQFWVLLHRGLNDVKRNKARGKGLVIQAIVMGIILSLIWFQIDDDAKSVQDRAGVIFFMSTYGMMSNCNSVLSTFGAERGTVLREQENQMYRTLPYFLSRVLSDMPVKLVGPVLFGTISYWSVGLQSVAYKYFMFLCVTTLLAMAGNAMGLLLSCIFLDVTVALAVSPLVTLPMIMFCGFVINPESIPIYLRWMEWISPTKYAFAALIQIEFGGLSLHCTKDQLQRVLTPEGAIVSLCAFPSGEAYLDKLNIQEVLTIGNCIILLCVLVAVFTTIAYFGLVMITRKHTAQAKAVSGNSGKTHPSDVP